jgi:Family of unknown function (DUF6326)
VRQGAIGQTAETPWTTEKARKSMQTMKNAVELQDRRPILSTLWIFLALNYLFADVYALFFDPVLQKDATQQRLSGHVGSIQITQEFILLTAIVLETALVMVVLSRVLPYRANRWSNIIVGLFQAAFAATNLVGETFPNLFSIFFVAIELMCTLFIVWYAWTWPRPEGAMLTRA